jgi:hypothetical protein
MREIVGLLLPCRVISYLPEVVENISPSNHFDVLIVVLLELFLRVIVGLLSTRRLISFIPLVIESFFIAKYCICNCFSVIL